MTGPQLTFALTTASVALTSTALFYRGVTRHTASRRDSFLAAWTAGMLVALPVGWMAAALVNALGSI